MEMLKTIAKPVYNWVIGTDNDEVMKKFTTWMLPETQFRGHPEEYKIASHADEGDGAAVWTTLSQNSLKWDPEQNFEDSSNIVHLQCRRNVKLIDHSFKERLKSVSLVVTSLLTSLHDTSMDGMNKGFKKATDKFKKIIGTSEKIVVNADKILEILLEGQHNIIVIVGAATVAVLVLMVLVQIAYMIKLARRLRERNIESSKTIKEMQEKWNQLEAVLNNLVQEVNRARTRPQEIAVVPRTVQRVPTEDTIGNRGASRRMIPARDTDVFTLTREQ